MSKIKNIYFPTIAAVKTLFRMTDPAAARPPKNESAAYFSTVVMVVSGFNSRRMKRYVEDQQANAENASSAKPLFGNIPTSIMYKSI